MPTWSNGSRIIKALIAAKNPRALKIYNEYDQAQMSAFPQLTDKEISSILGYVRAEWKDRQAKQIPAVGKSEPTASAQQSGSPELIILVLSGVIVVVLLLIIVLYRVIKNMEKLL